jgi:four helix bundle protein
MNEQRTPSNEEQQPFKPTILRLEDLECYVRAREFRKRVSDVCSRLPKEETYRLKDQMLRSSRSVAANIAEGYGRHHHQENLQYCRQARGSLAESIDHLNCALDETFIGADLYAELRQEADTLLRILNGYIAYLRSAAADSKSRSSKNHHNHPTTINE